MVVVVVLLFHESEFVRAMVAGEAVVDEGSGRTVSADVMGGRRGEVGWIGRAGRGASRVGRRVLWRSMAGTFE